MTNENILEDKLLKLLFLIKIAKKIEGKTRLHKIIFLGKQEEGIDMGFEFVKYNYGPYSFELTQAVDTLQNLGLINVTTTLFASSDTKGFQTKQFSYSITNKADELTKREEDKMKDFIIKVSALLKKWNNVPIFPLFQFPSQT